FLTDIKPHEPLPGLAGQAVAIEVGRADDGAAEGGRGGSIGRDLCVLDGDQAVKFRESAAFGRDPRKTVQFADDGDDVALLERAEAVIVGSRAGADGQFLFLPHRGIRLILRGALGNGGHRPGGECSKNGDNIEDSPRITMNCGLHGRPPSSCRGPVRRAASCSRFCPSRWCDRTYSICSTTMNRLFFGFSCSAVGVIALVSGCERPLKSESPDALHHHLLRSVEREMQELPAVSGMQTTTQPPASVEERLK